MTYVVRDMVEILARHQLTELVAGNGIRAFSMSRPDSRTYSVLLLFTPEGIVLMGDLQIEGRATVSQFGYGLDWWAGEMDEAYLVSKFLSKKWLPEKAMADLRECAEAAETPKQQARFAALLDIDTQDELMDLALTIGVSCDELEGVGMAYDPTAAGWLCAVHQRFRKLWGAKA